MPLVPCQCTNCGAALEVDNEKEAAVCKFCGTPFIVEKAINIYKTVNVTTNTTDWKRLADNGMKLIARDYFEEKDLREIRKVLKDVSEEEFYVRFFEYVLEIDYSTSAITWLAKNTPEERIDEVVDYLYRQILKDFNKTAIQEIHFNIHKNYTKASPDFILNDKTYRSLLYLTYLGNNLKGKALEDFEYLKNEAMEEINSYAYASRDEIYAIGFYVWAYKDFLGADFVEQAKSAIDQHVGNLPLSNFRDDFGPINRLKQMGYKVNYTFKVSKDCIVHDDTFTILGKELPLENALKITDYEGNAYLLVKLSDTTATVVKLPGVNNTNFMYCFPNCEVTNFNNIERWSQYKESINGLKLEFVEGFSYKKTIKDSIFGILKSFIH